jgi:hypothetical protein
MNDIISYVSAMSSTELSYLFVVLFIRCHSFLICHQYVIDAAAQDIRKRDKVVNRRKLT